MPYLGNSALALIMRSYCYAGLEAQEMNVNS